MSRRLPWSLLVASFALNMLYGALVAVVIPALVAQADEEAKETHLAWIMAASSLVTMLLHPLVGSWSDRTRGRWGRRTPWILGGALAGAVAVALLGRAETVLAVGLGWLAAQPLLHLVHAPLDAVLADRVPPVRRPRVAALYAAGGVIGLAVGVAAAGTLVEEAAALTLGLAVAFAVVMLGFVLLEPDPTRSAGRRASLAWAQAWAVRDFRLVFIGRLLFVLGGQLVMGYLLYIVMAFTGADEAAAGRTVGLLTALHVAFLALGTVIAARMARGNRVRAVLTATTVYVGALTIPLLAPSLGGLTAFAIIAGLARGAYLSADLALMLDVLPSGGDHGRDMGVLTVATLLPQTAAPAVAGALLALSGNAYTVLFAGALIGVLASMPVIARVRGGRTALPEGPAG